MNNSDHIMYARLEKRKVFYLKHKRLFSIKRHYVDPALNKSILETQPLCSDTWKNSFNDLMDMACELMSLAHSFLFKSSNTESPIKQLYQTWLHVSDTQMIQSLTPDLQCLKTVQMKSQFSGWQQRHRDVQNRHVGAAGEQVGKGHA